MKKWKSKRVKSERPSQGLYIIGHSQELALIFLTLFRAKTIIAYRQTECKKALQISEKIFSACKLTVIR